jgi:hypothetical protein
VEGELRLSVANHVMQNATANDCLVPMMETERHKTKRKPERIFCDAATGRRKTCGGWRKPGSRHPWRTSGMAKRPV